MKKILIFSIVLALWCNFGVFAQDISTGKIPQVYTSKPQGQNILRDRAVQNNFGDMLATQGYTYGAQTGNTETVQLPSGVIGTLAPWTTLTAYASGMTSNGSAYYIIDNGDSLWNFNSATGAVTFMGVLTSAVGANGIAYNPANGQYYLCTGTDLYTLNIGTLTPTLVGPFNTGSAYMIDLCFDYTGTCYGYDLQTAMAYTINISTGAATQLGSLGFDPNFGQGMGYDYETGWIYLTAFNYTAFEGQLRVMDPETGYTNLLASFGLNQKDPFVPQSIPAALPGPGRATAPSPVNGNTGVPIAVDTDLLWTNSAGATSIEIWFGTDPLALVSIYAGTPITGGSVTTDYSTTYYWRVDETSGAGTTQGTLWSFTTESSPCSVYDLPVTADFEDGIFPPECWSVNPGIFLWDYGTGVSGYGNGNVSALANFYDNIPGTTEDFISLEYNSAGAPLPQLRFDWAYADYSGTELDEMDIYYSTDSGLTWVILAAMYNGAAGDNNLNPFGLSYSGGYYIPADDEWTTRVLDLPANTTNVKFTAISDYGNLLWFDNVQITSELYETSFEPAEGFSYPGQVACQDLSGYWTTWSGAPCGNEDATISQNYAHTGTQSALIDYVAPRDVDLVWLSTSTKTTGRWYTNFWFYIPTGKAGYFNAQATFTVDWGFECYFNADGSGELYNDGTVTFNYTQGQWNQCLVVVDLNTGTGEFWLGPGVMTQLAVWDWTQAGTIPNTLDGFDFFGATTSDEFYIDDFRFSDSAPPIPQLAADVGTVSIDLDYVVGPGTVSPVATVKNYGTDTQTFDVNIAIDGYTDIQTVTSLAGGATQQVTFANWTAATGGYNVTVTTALTGDQDPTNDSKNGYVTVWDESGDWSNGTNFPVAGGYYLGSAASYGSDYLYVTGGNPGPVADCYEYNVSTDTWTQKASMPAPKVIHASAIVGDNLYVIGGSDGTNYLSSAEKYNILTNTWSSIAPLPLTVAWGKAVGYTGGPDPLIYFVGGVDAATNGNELSDVYVYNITTNTWATATSVPVTVFGGGLTILGDKLIYVSGIQDGGLGDNVYIGLLTPGSPTTIAWTQAESTYPGVHIGYPTCANKLNESVVSEPKPLRKGQVAEFTPFGGIYKFDAAPWGSDAIIVAGGNDGNPDYWTPKFPNPCFIYYPDTDTWEGREVVPEPILAQYLGSVNDGSTWKLIVASGLDTLTTSSTGQLTQIFTESIGGTTTAYSVNVANGWNMVSVAGTNPGGMAPSVWWPGLTGNVYKYAGGYTPITTTATGEGYWMKHTGPTVYNYTGIQIVPHNDVPINAGWNLLGLYENSVPTNTLQTSPPGMIILPVYAYSGGYVQAATMDPGVGYWVKSSGAGVITSLAPPPTGKSGEMVEYFKEDWGRIILTDATGVNYTLYAVQGEVDLNQYELPPAPPEGMFDIRYGSGRIAENLNSGSQTIEMSGVSYPVTISVENMNATLQDVSGKGINSQLKPGEKLVINNSSVNKLVVLSGELAVPTEYALEQNYPNPFNPTTTIKFAIPEATNVRLVIYNALGQKVAELVNSKLETGRYSYRWDAGNSASGMYIYELRTDNFVSVKKMLLLK